MKWFTKRLLAWYDKNKREMPWKNTSDPYKIWLSEIILQQTRVEQGWNYYEKIIRLFPTVQHLARAAEDEVLKAWEGLGYYARARNLHHAAKQIVEEFKGKFPSNYESILKLKGIGPYSAAAISSFAYNLPHAVVDGNVMRVLARCFGIKQAVDSTEGKKTILQLASQLLDKKNPGSYNQAIMNFGALVCTPRNAQCTSCIFKNKCVAFISNSVYEFPVKSKKITTRVRWFTYLCIEHRKKFLIEKRTASDIWKGLYQFPLIETPKFLNENELKKKISKAIKISAFNIAGLSPVIQHKLSHQTLMIQVVRVKTTSTKTKGKNQQWAALLELKRIAFPVALGNYLKKLLP